MSELSAATLAAKPRNVPEYVTNAIHKLKRPVMIAHVTPDADALGSMFGMAIALASSNCTPRVSLPEGSLSLRLAFLADWAKPVAATREDFEQADGFVVLDTARRSRCLVDKSWKDTEWADGRPMIVIDHHGTNTQFGTVNWVVGDAGSTCELVYDVLVTMETPINAVCASMLYAGIHSDTHGFSLRSTTASALRTTAELVRMGADVGEIGELLYHTQARSEFELMRVVYANTKVVEGGSVAYSVASHDDIASAGCSAADIDDQVSVPRALVGVKIAIFFSEGIKGETRINFRGKGGTTVVELAQRFGGGGHAQSAGAILPCGVEAAVEQVLPAAIEHTRNQ